MAKKFTPKVLTANDLLSGHVIYRGADNAWVDAHKNAVLYTDQEEAEAALKVAEGEAARIVGPYLADAVEGPDGPEPVHFRERFRVTGPTYKGFEEA
ncbi:DUF2849 domain-containing protein [Paracoccaceae bacterium GXU_MW_L88]